MILLYFHPLESNSMTERIHRPMRYLVPGSCHKSIYDRSGIDNFEFFMSYFDGVIERSKVYKLKSDFSRTNKSFREFVSLIGPVPEGMENPTVGRLDHSKGYIRGNFKWQSKADNCSEAAIRTNGAHETGAHQIVTCPHCGKSSSVLIMKRWHFDRCKFKAETLDAVLPESLIECDLPNP